MHDPFSLPVPMCETCHAQARPTISFVTGTLGGQKHSPAVCLECLGRIMHDRVSADDARRELVSVRADLRHVLEENADLTRRVGELEDEREGMTQRIDRMAAELAKPADERLAEVCAALEGRVPIYDQPAQRVRHMLGEYDATLARLGEAERERDAQLNRANRADGQRAALVRILQRAHEDAEELSRGQR